MSQQIVTPVGRIVWGHPNKGEIKKDQKTKQPVIRDGQQVQQWVFGLAIPKNDFIEHVWPAMQATAAEVYPSGVPSNFSWKYKDGDSIDNKGKPYSDRDGYAGCYVLTISTEAFAPQVYKQENGSYRQMQPEEVKTGDYVAVNVNFVGNKPSNPTHTPGLYVNPNGIVHVGYGAEIVSAGGDPDELFAGAQFALPAGASAQPVAPAAMPAMMPQQAAPLPAPAMMPQQAAPLPAPATDFVQNAGMMPQQAAPSLGQATPLPLMPGMPR